ncbi:lasso RiPP family leader peptide-containing protein [Streptomyces iconiensis]|uniref:Lasso RiPP family leader peptide-containing protein n=1 Tax=Streptomyces iconiensis TaxID=1384038 RepID=A0ABT6ZNC2_9ACTN|nr:lasso RiPP family leader peptide-containing protein [Streptomyces iconiensis]MDJ1130564.1 lasso RiPP family leader peptide-containing protein [Streptomyces iconiensis]
MDNVTLNIEPDDVYETPLLAEAGDFTEHTQGANGWVAEGSGSRRPGI